MAFAVLEDLLDAVEVIIFPNVYSSCANLLESTEPVIIQGTLQKDERGVKIMADSVELLDDARQKYTESITIRLDSDKISRKRMERVKKLFYEYHGDCPIHMTMHFTGKGEVDIETPKEITLNPCRALTESVEKVLGYQALSFQKKPVEVKARKKWHRGN